MYNQIHNISTQNRSIAIDLFFIYKLKNYLLYDKYRMSRV